MTGKEKTYVLWDYMRDTHEVFREEYSADEWSRLYRTFDPKMPCQLVTEIITIIVPYV